MGEFSCPWCEAELVLDAAGAGEQRCSECLTVWAYEDEAATELALAA